MWTALPTRERILRLRFARLKESSAPRPLWLLSRVDYAKLPINTLFTNIPSRVKLVYVRRSAYTTNANSAIFFSALPAGETPRLARARKVVL